LSIEELVILGARILGSLPVLRWAFGGALIAILVDFSDLFMMNLLNLGGVRDYQSFDKLADIFYMSSFMLVALRWSGTPRNVAVALFAFRIVGIGVFELIAWRGVLLFFPNVFDFWFVLVSGLMRFKPSYHMTRQRAVFWVSILLILKVIQEYVLHWSKWLDNYRATDVVVNLWNAIW
tara:strand:- start:111 stop:644 length:534 start_codon:yes stop_codon:yes gene_type:complete